MLRACVASLFLLAGCEGGPHPLSWRYRFDPVSLGDGAVTLEARILGGGCTSTDVRYGAVFARGEPTGMTPPRLSSGRFGFDVRALDGSCAVVARGCEDVVLPLGARTLTVPLGPPDGAAPPCGAASCRDGFCESPDAGPDPDAGPARDSAVPPTCPPESPCRCPAGSTEEDCTFFCTGPCAAECDDTCHLYCRDGSECAMDCRAGANCFVHCGDGFYMQDGPWSRSCTCDDRIWCGL